MPNAISIPYNKTKSEWQISLNQAVSDPEELFRLVELTEYYSTINQFACQKFQLKVPRGFIARMTKGNPQDPLLLQVLPQSAELQPQPGFSLDPLQESANNPLPGLLHKYQGRVLMLITGACAINCRYCFRRHFPYAENNPGKAGWQKALAYIAADPSIHEVILSGGDPLLASDTYLRDLAHSIQAIPHIKTLRIHTRLPIVLPERICNELIAWLSALRLRKVIVMHCNHPQEIDTQVQSSLSRLKIADTILLNQTVLLKGVNDNTATLANLSEALFQAGVLPYYLHLLDKVQGAAHFAVAEETAKQLMAKLVQLVPGYLVPRLVKEVAGAYAKVPIPITLGD